MSGAFPGRDCVSEPIGQGDCWFRVGGMRGEPADLRLADGAVAAGAGSGLAGTSTVSAALLLVDVEIDVLRDRHLASLVGGALCGFDGGLVKEVVAGVGADCVESCR